MVVEELEPLRIHDIDSNLYPFQKEAVERMASMPNILLFDTMGLGKTIETIAHIEKENLKPCLILCPKSLKLNWWDEIYKWSGEESCLGETADGIVEFYFDTTEMYRGYYILHHDALAYFEKDPIREIITKIPWKAIAIDESHRFRNLNTTRTKALMGFSNPNKKKFIFLSGTPLVNSSFDLFPMLKMVGLFEHPKDFIWQYTYGRSTKFGYKVMGSKNKESLLTKLAPIYIRRLKEEVLKDLPSKIITTLRLDMPQDQRTIYNNFEEALCILLDDGEKLTSQATLAALIRLRQLNLDPTIIGRKSESSKTKAVLDLIEQAPKEKWVVFSTLKTYVYHLESKIPNSITLTGDDKGKGYIKAKRFQENPNIKVLIGTMKTMGEGLNLQSANNVIICDRWWNQMTVDQSIDRLHRVGQTKNVNVFILENDNSIDKLLREKCENKESMANELILQQDIIAEIYRKRRGYEIPIQETTEERPQRTT